MKKENEGAIKMAKAIATMRESGLKVTDETQKGGSIGITGVHDRREGYTEFGKPTNYAQASPTCCFGSESKSPIWEVQRWNPRAKTL